MKKSAIDLLARETRSAVAVILQRLGRGEPVTQEFIDRIPAGVRVELPLTIDGRRATLLIEGGIVTLH
jgi:hypothetical protein